MQQNKKNKILIEVGTNELEVITFYLERYDSVSEKKIKNAYGINAAKVRELVALPSDITEIAESPSCVKGVFVLRNNTVPLIDLCDWFSYETRPTEEDKQQFVVIVAELNGKPFGFLTHGVDKVYRVSWSQIIPPPGLIADSQSLTGICQVNDQLIQMIDFERIAAAIDPEMSLEKESEEKDEIVSKNPHEKAVLIIDDSRVILLQLTRTLESAGYKVIEKTDGLLAWDYLEELREQGQLNEEILAIISDIEMPQMDGHHLCLKVKKDPAYKRIPFILHSSMINDSLRRKGEVVGADDQVTKTERHQIVDRINRCLQMID